MKSSYRFENTLKPKLARSNAVRTPTSRLSLVSARSAVFGRVV